MPDLETALDELRHASEHPPASPTPVDAIAGRARRRRAVRRSIVAAASILALSGTVAVVAAVANEEPVSELRTAGPADPQGEAPSTVPDAPEAGVASPLVVTPDEGLEDGQVVVVEGDFGDDAIVAMCAREVLDADDASAAVGAWCDVTFGWRSLGPGRGQVEVRRALDTGSGRVDCAERPGRCVVGVRDGTRDLAAPVTFRSDLPALDEPTITVPDGPFSDGQALAVVAEGLVPGDVYVTQCTTEPTTGGMDRCDQARASRAVAGPDGRIKATISVFSEILTYEGWIACDPCVLRAGRATTAIEFRSASGEPTRPRVTIEPTGPYAPGQGVTLRGSGFGSTQRGITVGWCGFSTETPEQEVQGDPTYGYAPCVYPMEGWVTTSVDGTFVVEDFPLPDGSFGWGLAGDCTDPAQRCGLAWHPGEGSLPAFVTLFEITG